MPIWPCALASRETCLTTQVVCVPVGLGVSYLVEESVMSYYHDWCELACVGGEWGDASYVDVMGALYPNGTSMVMPEGRRDDLCMLYSHSPDEAREMLLRHHTIAEGTTWATL